MRKRIYCPNDKIVMRIIPSLANEIGLNESIVFLQMEFLAGNSTHYAEGRYWFYLSLRDFTEEYFSFWSYSTVNRIIQKLANDYNLILVNNYNKINWDKTQWYAIHYEMVAALNSIAVIEKEDDANKRKNLFQNETPPKKMQIETDLFQNETPHDENETGQNTNETGKRLFETTIPETYKDLSKTYKEREEEKTKYPLQTEINNFFEHHKKHLMSKKQNELPHNFFTLEQLGNALNWDTKQYDKLVYWKSKHEFWGAKTTDNSNYLLKALKDIALNDIPKKVEKVRSMDDELMESLK